MKRNNNFHDGIEFEARSLERLSEPFLKKFSYEWKMEKISAAIQSRRKMIQP